MSDPSSSVPSSAARLIGEAVVHARAAAAPHEQAAADARTAELAQGLTSALRPVVSSLVGQAVADLPSTHPLAQLVATARSGPSPGTSTGPGTLNPPGTLPHPGGIVDDIVEAFLTVLGIVGAAFGILPALGQVITREYVQGLNAEIPTAVIPAPDLADMVERGIITAKDGEAEASQSGFNARRFDLLSAATGEPPGIVQALELLRRGEVSLDWFARVVAYSRVRTEYLPELVKLGWATMTPADAIELALKEEVPNEVARALFVAGGGMPRGGPPSLGRGETLPAPPDVDQFDLLLAAAGNPIGPEAAANLRAHGLITEEQFDQVVAHSRINPRFAPLVKLTHRKWLSVFQVEAALKAGTVTAEEATSWLLADGYEADQVAAFVAALSGPAHVRAKEETEGQIVTLYEAQELGKEQAIKDLGELGYNEASAELILRAADGRRVAAQRTAAIGKVRAAYLADRYDGAKARAELAGLGVASEAVDGFLAAWEVERGSQIRELTAAQIGTLVHDNYREPAWALERWVRMGYTAEDAANLLAIHAGIAPPGSPLAVERGRVSGG